MAEPPAYLRSFLESDWAERHFANRFCFRCARAICSHSCSNHAAHHGGGGGGGGLNDYRVVAVKKHSLGCAVLDADVGKQRIGFDLTGIQHLGKKDDRSIPINRPVRQDDRLKGEDCPHYGYACKSGSRFCSIGGKLALTQGGRNRDVAQRLVDLAATFTTQTHRNDRFCIECRTAFCERSCVHHTIHHPLHAENEDDGALVAVESLPAGWLAVEEGQLPPEVVAGVQTIEAGGTLWFPMTRSGAAPPAAAALGGGGHICEAPGCVEPLQQDGAQYCRLRCKYRQLIAAAVL